MHTIEGLIPFKSYIDQAMAPLYFLRMSSSFCSLCFVKSADMITGLDFPASRKAYFRCLGNSFIIKPFELVFVYETFSS